MSDIETIDYEANHRRWLVSQEGTDWLLKRVGCMSSEEVLQRGFWHFVGQDREHLSLLACRYPEFLPDYRRFWAALDFWNQVALNLSGHAANALASARCETITDVRRLGLRRFAAIHGMKKLVVEEVTEKIGWGNRPHHFTTFRLKRKCSIPGCRVGRYHSINPFDFAAKAGVMTCAKCGAQKTVRLSDDEVAMAKRLLEAGADSDRDPIAFLHTDHGHKVILDLVAEMGMSAFSDEAATRLAELVSTA